MRAVALALAVACCTACTVEAEPASTSGGADGGGGLDSVTSTTSGAVGGGGAAPAPPAACVDYAQGELFDDGVSFRDDVIPIMQQRCAAAECHSSDAVTPKAGLRLGVPGSLPSSGDVDSIHAALVGVGALRAHMPLIAPGDPSSSFVLVKTEYAMPTDCDQVQCKAAGCGSRMPVGADSALDEAQLRALRTWIRDGAAND